MTFFTLYLASLGDTMTKLMTYVPFSFMRAIFTSGQQSSVFAKPLFCLLGLWFCSSLRQLSTKSEPLCKANKVRVSSGFFFMASKTLSRLSLLTHDRKESSAYNEGEQYQSVVFNRALPSLYQKLDEQES